MRRWMNGPAIGTVALVALVATSVNGQAVKDKKASAAVDGVALVNGEVIPRAALADELISVHGARHLATMIDRKLVEQACRVNKIEVTHAEINADVKNQLRVMNMSPKEFKERVLDPRGVTYGQHLRDNVWPKLALTKLVGPRVKVTDEDLRKGFEANYGPKVDCRMLVVMELKRATDLWDKLNNEPPGDKRLKMFEDYCKEYSIDSSSKPFGGQIQPINRHSSNPELEKELFGLKEGAVSKVMQMAGGHMMFLCVKHIKAQEAVTLDTVVNPQTGMTIKKDMQEKIYLKKLAHEAERFMEQVRRDARIENYLTGEFDPESLKMATKPEPANTK